MAGSGTGYASVMGKPETLNGAEYRAFDSELRLSDSPPYHWAMPPASFITHWYDAPTKTKSIGLCALDDSKKWLMDGETLATQWHGSPEGRPIIVCRACVALWRAR